MEGLILLVVVVAVVLIVVMMSKIEKLDKKVNAITHHLRKKALTEKQQGTAETPEKIGLHQPITPQKPVVEEIKPTEPVKEVEKPVTQPQPVAQAVTPPIRSVSTKKVIKLKPPKPRKPSFMERNPDLEKFIGENLLPKIGITIFVIGMGFLVKLGIDNDVITESMRVAIGILIGGGMIGLAHYLRKSFATFSSILIGGALCVLYFTIALAFHEYALIPQTAAFVIMVVITAFGVLLSITYDRKELAILALIGGFGTPFFVSTGAGNYQVLLTYILILDIGMLTLVYFKKWNIVNYLTYGFTYILFAGVFASEFIDNADSTRGPLIIFLTAFYLIFFLMNIIFNVKNNKKFGYPEIIMLLSNSAIYFGLGLSLLHGYKDGLFSGVFTALIAIFNFVFTFVLYKRKDIDKNLLFLLIGLVLTFVSLIAPIQLKGNFITLFWAIEAVLLLWLSQKSGIQLMKAVSVLISGLMLISLGIDWQQNYYPTLDYVVLKPFLNKAFITSLAAMGSLAGIIFLLKKDDGIIDIKGIQLLVKSVYAKALFLIVCYLGFLLELNYQFIHFELESTFRIILLGIYNYGFVILLIAIARFRPSVLLTKLVVALSALSVFSYLTFYLTQVVTARNNLFRATEIKGIGNTGFYWHYVLLAFFLFILINGCRIIYTQFSFKSKEGRTALWVLSFIGVYVASAEIGHLSMLYQSGSGRGISQVYRAAVKSVYPVVWAVTALALMIVGMKYKLKTLRIASLVLFAVTIVKLFFYDLAGNSTGKVVSFILLGVILLVISFLYQKLKFIIQDDETRTTGTN
ncbi:MAG: DUF2339 domain-containing protein [Cyclobacteriaceae bacterium]